MKKREYIIICMVVMIVLSVASDSSGEWPFSSKGTFVSLENTEKKTESNVNNPIATIPVSQDISVVNGTQASSDNSLSPGTTAQAVASGYIESGKTKGEIISSLIQIGYSQTEAEIAYSKASVNYVVQPQAVVVSGSIASAASSALEAQTEETINTANTVEPVQQKTEELKPAEQRITEGLGQNIRPRGKFGARVKNNYTQEGNIAKDMLNEGYTVEQIVDGYAKKGYAGAKIAKILNIAGVSASDAYQALSTASISKAEAAVYTIKPTGKFKSIFKSIIKTLIIKLGQTQEQKLETRENAARQEAIKSTVNEMQAAGYDIKPALDSIVQNLKDTGMSAQQAKDFLISKVADGKPRAKFHGGWFISRTQPRMTSAGEGEINLAAAMLQAGYSKEEVQSTFESKRGRFYVAYSYTPGAITGIMSAAENRINGTNQPRQTTNTNTQLESDILKRATNALPI
ncbi:MAG: hypothetical protein KJ893_00900 [Candidatus Omnitrophica bacterium]|nr:hypothetical protein [Candidatus Omnitrophota bacterium]MBU4479159.1 hypothetical protein [Candidatus Omnitrophota bacterium]MCG2702798.1 hypothetical protein [Candidatus Omnitrophota bacterium]